MSLSSAIFDIVKLPVEFSIVELLVSCFIFKSCPSPKASSVLSLIFNLLLLCVKVTSPAPKSTTAPVAKKRSEKPLFPVPRTKPSLVLGYS